ncbi:hypothetical protein ACLOJK_013070 [Asimina triloba]
MTEGERHFSGRLLETVESLLEGGSFSLYGTKGSYPHGERQSNPNATVSGEIIVSSHVDESALSRNVSRLFYRDMTGNDFIEIANGMGSAKDEFLRELMIFDALSERGHVDFSDSDWALPLVTKSSFKQVHELLKAGDGAKGERGKLHLPLLIKSGRESCSLGPCRSSTKEWATSEDRWLASYPHHVPLVWMKGEAGRRQGMGLRVKSMLLQGEDRADREGMSVRGHISKNKQLCIIWQGEDGEEEWQGRDRVD